MDRRVVVAVPAKNESETLPACLEALLRQEAAPPAVLLILVNNSSDTTAEVARSIGVGVPGRVIVEDIVLPCGHASAGAARRLAMDKAAVLSGDNGVLFTTDADSRVSPDWLRANLRAIDAGADAVAGRAVIDPSDEALIPKALIETDARECAYAALLDEIAAQIDPDPNDPWPRHDQHSGASIAVTTDAFRKAGGIPALAMGEDRAFFDSLRRIDARIRHDPEVFAIVSGRTVGRATGGMADTIRRRMVCPDLFLDDRLEAVSSFVLRIRMRRQARMLWQEVAANGCAVDALANGLKLPTAAVRIGLHNVTFGAAWEDLQALSPALRRRPVANAAVDAQIAAATAVLAAEFASRSAS